jgi:DNA-binding transcriptional LysR family regulator
MQSLTAKKQSTLDANALLMVLALVRAGSLARAGAQLGVDASTVLRALQRLERGSGQRLFERGRGGWRASELAQRWAAHAERIEAELEIARAGAPARGAGVAGQVRISTTDTLLAGVLLPALPGLAVQHPQLTLELSASNEPASLTRRDADIALRATKKPPQHLIGRLLGPIRAAVYAARPARGKTPPAPALADCPWIAPDPALPDHLSVRWRQRHLPRIAPRLEVDSILAVQQAVAAGLGVGIVPCFLAERDARLVALTEPLDECETQLWLLTHPESRHLRRIATVAAHLAHTIRMT